MFPPENPIASRLEPGETLIWSGQPKQGVRLQPQDALMIPFSLMWGGFAIVWEAGVVGVGTGLIPSHPNAHGHAAAAPLLFMSLWGIPFVLVGLYLIFGRFFYDAALRRKTFYAVTDRRAIVLKKHFSLNLLSYDLFTLSTLNVSERADGSGSILFGAPNPMGWIGTGGWPGSGRYVVPGFYLLPKVQEVYGLIRHAQTAARRGPSV